MILQAACLFTLLTAIAAYDLRYMIIPNSLNLALASAGAVFAFAADGDSLLQGLAASVMGGGFLLAMRQTYAKLRGVMGLGLGDVKFMFAAGFWLTPFHLPWLILIASLSGITTAIILRSTKLQDRLAFGPHLALGLAVSWLLKVNNVL